MKEYIESKELRYIPVENSDSVNKISELFLNGIHFEPKLSEELNYYGVYYQYIEKDYLQLKNII